MIEGEAQMKPFTTFAAILFALIALAHLYRLIFPFPVIVGSCSLPQWVSMAGLIVAGGLAVMLWRESRR
jgi:hypothetical protein